LQGEGSVSRAADRLGLTQPAVSHALSRLRRTFGDDLFVRSGAGMAATPVGERVAGGAGRALDIIRREIWEPPSFDHETTRRRFRVSLSDMGGTVLLPRLVAALAVQAPHATIVPIQAKPEEIGKLLEDGAADLAIGFYASLGLKLYQRPLFRRSMVGIARAGSAAIRTRMTLTRFVGSRHVIATGLAVNNEVLRKELRRRGKVLDVALEVPYLLAVPGIVADSDLLAAVPAELAALFAKVAAIEAFPLPIRLPDLTVRQYWHARYHHDAGHRWFRGLVEDAIGDADHVVRA
jgi:DNA-binding transcriptional LysR family regulator